MMKKTQLTTLTALILSVVSANVALADDKHVDPSDVARAVSSFTTGISNTGKVKALATMAVPISEEQQAMVVAEGNMTTEGKYSDARVQYFHVFNLENSAVPKVAASLDVIDNSMVTSAALGGVAAINTHSDRFTVFLRAGALAGEYKEDFASGYQVTNRSAVGGTAAAFLNIKTGSDGTFFTFNPEYTYLDGDAEVSTLKTTLRLATPMSQDKKRWGELRLENTQSNITTTTTKSSAQSDTTAWFLYRAYF
ncbi:hypothetical protein [Vibrio agarivorans]|uniref:DUF481 domain-containing protein n=1 Tax=Vibrio agarivorans TaxID=153622 RepID=A0ABT7Y477_9VIBR|nr:hypothetical protein [Vibrio agarivorans]MDN2482846.1 hypothetical protein [Vibrio agarivorans]